MSGVNQSLNTQKPSIRYRSNPLNGAFIELKNFDCDENTPESPKSKQNHNISEHKSPQILSTRELVSAIGHVWDSTTSLLSKRNSRFDHKQSQNQAIDIHKSSNGKDSSSMIHEHFEYLRVTQRASLIELSRTFLQSSSNVSQVIQSCEVRNIYQWMNDLALVTPKQDVVINNDKIEIKPAKYANDSNIIPSSNDSSILKQTESKSNHSSNNCYISSEEKHKDLQKNDTKNDFFIQSKEKSLITTVKTKHAFAGAMAGICVSVCLHPIDTIKTIVQSCHVNQNSLHQINKSILLERGVTGLYRGISSNIASSAPISAIYTFTYESVKGALLPLFPKEYQSMAHCIAGGSASIATSFVFTPSERIKQQMQVGSHYHNCWNALIEIVGKGGLRSLYAGWGAVLCRNVPHSIIKFYMYESLKQLVFPAEQSSGQTNTLVTLTCGGLAGSTAAFFTTPFDVVKTRLQTQVPGSINQYNGVLNTLINIGKREGLKGLYRGLTPRLFMYMTQGALFFASYEFFKKLFALEVPRLNAQKDANNKRIPA